MSNPTAAMSSTNIHPVNTVCEGKVQASVAIRYLLDGRIFLFHDVASLYTWHLYQAHITVFLYGVSEPITLIQMCLFMHLLTFSLTQITSRQRIIPGVNVVYDTISGPLHSTAHNQ